jgi:inositol 1,4,5-triphosphate receptor type 1/inositol 1,4,5-triphosphate receptor type 3
MTVHTTNSTLFEFMPLKASDNKDLTSGVVVFIRNVENNKYIDIVSKLDEGGVTHTDTSAHLANYLKPIIRNQSEKDEHALFKLYLADPSETWELMFLDSANKSLLKYLYCISNFVWKNDSTDVDALKIVEKKLYNASTTVGQMDFFINNKVCNSTPT